MGLASEEDGSIGVSQQRRSGRRGHGRIDRSLNEA